MRGQVITINDYDWRKRDRTELDNFIKVSSNQQLTGRKDGI